MPLGFDFFLIAMCTLYAIKTRNVPENFNEAKFIGFTMYTTLVIWIAFVAIYLSNTEHKVTLLSLCISFSALFALFLLFFPKCYIIILKPEKNNRSFFTTTKKVRCHIGFIQQAPNSSNSATNHNQQPSGGQQRAPNSSISEPAVSSNLLLYQADDEHSTMTSSAANDHLQVNWSRARPSACNFAHSNKCSCAQNEPNPAKATGGRGDSNPSSADHELEVGHPGQALRRQGSLNQRVMTQLQLQQPQGQGAAAANPTSSSLSR